MSKEANIKTSWSDIQLNMLCDPANHKISYDGFEYQWMHNITGKWESHTLTSFEDYNKPYSWLQFWLSNWSQELTARRIKLAANRRYRDQKIQNIVDDLEWTTFKKVAQIYALNPNLSQLEIGNLINVGQATVFRYLKDLKKSKMNYWEAPIIHDKGLTN